MDGKSLLQKNITNNKTIIKFTDELREWFFLGEWRNISKILISKTSMICAYRKVQRPTVCLT